MFKIDNMTHLKNWYINFLEKSERRFEEKLIYGGLFFLSLVYGAVVYCKNFLYDCQIIPSFRAKKIISIGNICWAGAGKTTLTMKLFDYFSPDYKTAILRRGYGQDEKMLLQEKTADVFSDKNRIGLVKKLHNTFDLFIVDDGFQYRKLYRDLNIVIMSAREFKRKFRLIPADFFREPIAVLKRAHILIINYKSELDDSSQIYAQLKHQFPQLKIYWSDYTPRGFFDQQNIKFPLTYFVNRPVAVFTAIGYPQGFINKLNQLNINIARQIIYPDHYVLTEKEFITMQEDLLKQNITELIITAKDKYHIPKILTKLKIYCLDIQMDIEKQDELLNEIKLRLNL
jgi:tetraacyldisaccharide 4'-kinase